MNYSTKNRRTIIVVDGYSSGAAYPDAIRRYGLAPVHVSSKAAEQSTLLQKLMKTAIEGVNDNYIAHFNSSLNKADLLAHSPVAVVAGCESGVELADKLSADLGLPGNPVRSSPSRRDKFIMQQALARAGLRSIKSFQSGKLEAILDWAQRLDSWPVIIKPLCSSGTQGVCSCAGPRDLEKNFKNLMGTDDVFGSKNSRVMVQEQVQGREYVVNTVSVQGRHFISDMWEYNKIIEPGKPPLYDTTRLVPEMDTCHREVAAYGLAALDALGIVNGPAHTEIMLTEEGPVLIESGARPMGGGAAFPPEIIEKCLGYTQVQLVVESIADPETFSARFDSQYSPKLAFMNKCMISTRQGKVGEIPGIILLSRLKSVVSGDFTRLLGGEDLPLTVNLLTSPAFVVMCHEDERVIRHDYNLIRELEQEAQNELFELNPEDEDGIADPDWFSRIPDELWLKPEDASKPEAEIIDRLLRLAPGEKILDCPCGDGRVGQWLARKGIHLTGVDINPRFIDRARERFKALGIEAEFQASDMRRLTHVGEFDAIVNWFNSFGYFGIEDDILFLTLMSRALRPEGRILIEAPNRDGVDKNIRPKYDSDGIRMSSFWDKLTERMLIPVEIEQDGKKQRVVTSARMYSLAQYRLLFCLTGLEMTGVWDENANPFDGSSRRMIMIGRKIPPEEAMVRLPL